MAFCFRLAACLLAIVTQQAVAEGDAAAGQAKSAICSACHGADGNSMVPQWPKLAGQHRDYLVRQVTLIKAGARPVPEMVGIVATLSDQDIADIAAWFAAQQMSAGVAKEEDVFAGQRLWRAGDAQSGVPACMACHGPAGAGNPLAGYPALAGQQQVYVANILKRFRAGENWGDKDAPSHVMNGVAAELTDDDIKFLASYIQGLYLVED
ncbi:MAG: cytochrome c4 [Xanthomonadales bacterium]|nr:cytochrome c4 [Xanthomonadales bacterium]